MKIFLKYLIIFFVVFSNELYSRNYIVIQSTTSTANTGLLDYLGDFFYDKTGIQIRTVAVGTGQAIKNARKGDGDILLVHSKKDELQFVNEGLGVKRYDLMYNDFLIIGPTSDPAKIKSLGNLELILKKISKGNNKFISRDDNSGTHKKELYLWDKFDIKTNDKSWSIKSGTSMLSTISLASELNAYTLSDRASWITFENKKFLEILYEQNEILFNPYGIIALNPNKFPHVEFQKSTKFINWLLSDTGQSLISNYKVNGNQLFFLYE